MITCNATSMLTEVPLATNSVTMMMFYENKDKKSELVVKAFGFEEGFMIGDGASENPTAYTISTILFYGHPNSRSNLPETPSKMKKTKESKDAGAKAELPPVEAVESVQKQRKPSTALSLLKNAKKGKSVNNHGNLEIIKPTAMEDGKWYRVSADTMRALGYTKENEELFVTITPVLQTFFKFVETHGKRVVVSTWVGDISGEDASDSDSVFKMLFADESSSEFELNLLQYSILKECFASTLPNGAKAENACVHLNAASRTLQFILGKAAPPADRMKDATSAKKRGVSYLKFEDAIKKITDVDAENMIVWLCLGASVFGIASGSKGSANEAVTAQWTKFFSLLPEIEADNNTD